MAGVKTDISLQVNNTLDRPAKFSLLGGTQDPSNGQANAKTLYEWDLTTETFANTNLVEIQASTVDNPQVITYTASNGDGEIRDLETVVRLLNTLNLGVFNVVNNVIWIIDDINIFGGIEIKISKTFNIDNFVADAYAYFDPNQRTNLVDFSNEYKPSIQSAVDNISDFVTNIETQGWSCCYLFRSKNFTIQRQEAGDLFLIVNNNPPTVAQNTNTIAGGSNTGKFLLYTANKLIYKNANITLSAVDTLDSLIYKYIFTGNVRFQGNNGIVGSTMGWKFLDPTYTQVNDGTYVGGGQQTTRTQFVIEELDPAYSPFPNIDIGAGGFPAPTLNLVSFASTDIGNPLVLNNNQVSFGSLPSNALFNIDFLEINNAGTSNYALNFNTLQLTDGFTTNFILSSFVGDTILTLDSAFNTKFGTTEFGFKSQNLTFDVQNGFSLELQFDDFTTPLRLNFVDEITWSNLVIANKLPPIDQIGGFNTNGTEFSFFLNLANQQIGATLTMGYYNDWFEKLGSQDWIIPRVKTVVGGNRSITANGTYYLSGLGLVGFKKLQEFYDGFNSILVSANAEVTNSIYLSTLPNPTSDYVGVVFQRQGGAEPTINYRYSSVTPTILNQRDYQTDVVTTSTTVAGLQYGCQLPSGGGAIAQNEIFNAVILLPVAFTNDNTCTIGALTSRINAVSSIYIESLDANISSRITAYFINGLALTLDKENGSFTPRNLYNRNFKGVIDGIVIINHFTINSINYIQNNAEYVNPYGSRSLFNFTNTATITTIDFQDCDLGTSNVVNDPVSDILSIFFDNGFYPTTATRFIDCQFNLSGGTNTATPTFNIFQDGAGTPALLGLNQFIRVTFSKQLFTVELILNSNYDGNGQTCTRLDLVNCDVEKIDLIGTRTAVPPATTLVIEQNANLTFIGFANHNVDTFTFANNPLITRIDLSGNALTDAQLDTLINYTNSIGTSNGTLDYSNQTTGASPTLASTGSYLNLQNNGWTIIGDAPPVP